MQQRVRKLRPAWNVEEKKQEGLVRLEAATIAEAKTSIRCAVACYRTFCHELKALRKTIEWMYAMSDKKPALPFDDVCRNLDCAPDSMRDVLLWDVPRGLSDIVFRNVNFTCPFIPDRHCGRKK